MPRDIPIGNGNTLIAFDRDHLLREFFFPHVGEENHTGGEKFRFGFWVDGQFNWVPEGWQIKQDYLDDTLVTDVELVNENIGIKAHANDLVDFQENIYLKKIAVTNITAKEKEARVFFCHDFHIYGNDIGDTALFRPEIKCLLHYKQERYFLINALVENDFGIRFFACGNKEHKALQGAWKDAEDGLLSQNPIAQGSVDSVAAVHLNLGPYETKVFYYWVCAGKNWEEVERLNKIIRAEGPEEIIKRTINYWKFWVDKEELNYDLIPAHIASLYKRSLLILRTQIDQTGAVIAGNDSDVVQFNRDTYSYMWPRDGALTMYALDLAGYTGISKDFFNLCGKLISKEGYFLHKYTPSGAVASSWHPWLKEGRAQLPIQEDETALVVWALWNHFKAYKDIEFIKALYKPLIKNAADFMLFYRDNKTGLPLPSYDLWEEKQGVFTFTACAVFGGLVSASNFARAFGEEDIAEQYQEEALKLRSAIDKYLYLENEKRFAKMVRIKENGQLEVDKTIDASLFGTFAFGAYDVNDEKVANTMKQVYEKLWCRQASGGLCRYENDGYYRVSEKVPGNPWFVTTLWFAQYLIAKAATRKELEEPLEILTWVFKHSLPSGVLAEQIDPFTHEPISVSPLTWSHATFVAAVQEYINKLLEIEKCTACNQSKYSKKRPR